ERLDLIMGTARFLSPHRVLVSVQDGGQRALEAPQIVINTGARPAIPTISGLDAIGFLDSTSIMELDEVPEHLLVIGGGYIGLEFAQMFRRFGSGVTIVQRSDQLLPHEDLDIATAVQEILQQDGIEVLVDHEAVEVKPRQDPRIELRLRTAGGANRKAYGSHLLVAVGRVPNSEMLELAGAGIDTDSEGYIRIDDKLRTSAEGVYAIGDVVPGPQFTHISYDDYRILRANLLRGEAQSRTNRFVPYTVYIDPQLGGVGLNERRAKKRGIAYRVATMPMTHVARALEVDETRGLMKVLVEKGSERILGASILGIEGGELMSMIQIAMMGDLPFSALREGIFAHPTLAESFNNLFASIGD
ncbi:MAG: FAD-dependent oxidoreductase, partial [Rhodothermales bacterium]|nr:FAD-dependent oxidoreductase [Rhodothermales bacterium]